MRIIFCLPGRSYTKGFFESWNNLRSEISARGDIQMMIALGSGASVVHVRNQIVAIDAEGLKRDAQPFGGMAYDYMMWIDSDSVFTPSDFFKLLEAEKDIITGLVPVDMSGRGALGLFNNYSPTKYLDIRGVKPNDPVFEVDFCGFAFVLIKHGVFESMTYPWFWSHSFVLEDGRIICPSEDFAWCIRAKKLGRKIHAHPGVNLGHEKQVTMQVEQSVMESEQPAGLLGKFIDRYDRAWRLSTPAIQAIERLMEQRHPQKILEVGPGASSLAILSWCINHNISYQALDHEGPYNKKHLATLQEANLPIDTTFAVPLDGDGWYKTVPPNIDKEAPYDLVLIDGPVIGRDSPRALAAYKRWGHANTVWVFDDAQRQSEKQVALQMAGETRRVENIQDPNYARKTFLLIPKEKK